MGVRRSYLSTISAWANSKWFHFNNLVGSGSPTSPTTLYRILAILITACLLLYCTFIFDSIYLVHHHQTTLSSSLHGVHRSHLDDSVSAQVTSGPGYQQAITTGDNVQAGVSELPPISFGIN